MMIKKAMIAAGILSLMVHCSSSFAQEIRCEEKYQLALAQYNFGLADSALSILEPCLLNHRIHKDLSSRESVNIYRLAALSSIMIGNPVDAERYIKELLRYEPDYAGNWREGDLMEFRHIIEGARPQPSLELGIRAGFNVPMLTLKKFYEDPVRLNTQHSLEGHTGFQFGIFGEKAISRNMALEAGLGMLFVYFDYLVQSESGESESGSRDHQYEQRIVYLEIPVLLKYYIPLNGALKPYLQGGATGRFSLYLRENSEEYGKYWLTESATGTNILSTFITDFENIGITLGGGISYDLKQFSIRADIRYNHHLDSKNKLAKFDDIQGYEDIPSSEAFGYTDDLTLITLSDLQVSLGFAYTLKYRVF